MALIKMGFFCPILTQEFNEDKNMQNIGREYNAIYNYDVR